MKLYSALILCITLFCAGCSQSGSSAQSFEESVSEACKLVQLGSDVEGSDNEARNSYWIEAAVIFRNLSNQNQNFTEYAEGLNAWATGSASGKIYDVLNFCGTT